MHTTVPVWVWLNRGLQHLHVLNKCRTYLQKQNSKVLIAQVIVLLEGTEEVGLVTGKNSADFESVLVTANYEVNTVQVCASVCFDTFCTVALVLSLQDQNDSLFPRPTSEGENIKEAISSSVPGIQNYCSLKLTYYNWLEQLFTSLMLVLMVISLFSALLTDWFRILRYSKLCL